MITEQEYLRTLGDPFIPEDWIILGEPGHQLLCKAYYQKGISALAIDEEELASACKDYAIQKGVKVFTDIDEVKKHLDWNGEAVVEPIE